MNKRELTRSLKDLADHIERHEVMANDGYPGDNVLSVQFKGGDQRIFYGRQQVEEWLEDYRARQIDAALREE